LGNGSVLDWKQRASIGFYRSLGANVPMERTGPSTGSTDEPAPPRLAARVRPQSPGDPRMSRPSYSSPPCSNRNLAGLRAGGAPRERGIHFSAQNTNENNRTARVRPGLEAVRSARARRTASGFYPNPVGTVLPPGPPRGGARGSKPARFPPGKKTPASDDLLTNLTPRRLRLAPATGIVYPDCVPATPIPGLWPSSRLPTRPEWGSRTQATGPGTRSLRPARSQGLGLLRQNPQTAPRARRLSPARVAHLPRARCPASWVEPRAYAELRRGGD